MKLSKADYKKIAVKAAMAGDSKKAGDVTILDLCGRSTLADFVVLMTVESAPQLEAVEEEISVRLKHDGNYCLHKDGGRSKSWKVMDYGGVLVHILETKAAETFSIGKIYADARPVEWRPAEAAPAKRSAPKKAAAKKAAAKKPAARKAKKTAKKPAKRPAAKKAKAARGAKKK